jgi:hypothetical protein
MNLEWGKEESHLDGSWTLVPHLYCCSTSSRPRAATSIRVGSPGSYVPARGQIRGRGSQRSRDAFLRHEWSRTKERGLRPTRGTTAEGWGCWGLRAMSSLVAGIVELRCLAALRNKDDAPSINRRRSLAAGRGNIAEAWWLWRRVRHGELLLGLGEEFFSRWEKW